MKQPVLFAITNIIAATIMSIRVHAEEVNFHVSESLPPGPAAMTVANARSALAAYTSACKAQDRSWAKRVMTADAEIEYTIDVPGVYFAVDINSLDGCWESVQSLNQSGPQDIWIYPTPLPEVVFLDLVTREGIGHDSHRVDHLALVRMSGGSIAQIRDFTTARPLTKLALAGPDSANSP